MPSNTYGPATTVDPTTGDDAVLYHPRRQAWREHFAWSLDGQTVLGKTPTGRATVERLRLNRPGVVNLRRALAAIGEHPPVDQD